MKKVYTIEYVSGEAEEVGSKKTAVAKGDRSGESYQVLSPSGQVVHEVVIEQTEPTKPQATPEERKALAFSVRRDYPGNYSIVTAPAAVQMAEAAGLEANVTNVKGRLNRVVEISGDDEAEVKAFSKVLDAAFQEILEALRVWQKANAVERRGLTDMEKYIQHREFISKNASKYAKKIKAGKA